MGKFLSLRRRHRICAVPSRLPPPSRGRTPPHAFSGSGAPRKHHKFLLDRHSLGIHPCSLWMAERASPRACSGCPGLRHLVATTSETRCPRPQATRTRSLLPRRRRPRLPVRVREITRQPRVVLLPLRRPDPLQPRAALHRHRRLVGAAPQRRRYLPHRFVELLSFRLAPYGRPRLLLHRHRPPYRLQRPERCWPALSIR